MSQNRTRARQSCRRTSEDALSPVVGEMLMIVLALLLVSIFSLSLAGLLPAGRGSTIDITHTEKNGNLVLWHKGGDWAEVSGLQILIIHDRNIRTITPGEGAFSRSDDAGNTCSGVSTDSRTFDLGDNICIDLKNVYPTVTLEQGDVIRLVNAQNVIFSGTANPS